MYIPNIKDSHRQGHIFKVEMNSSKEFDKKFFSIMRKAKRQASFFQCEWFGNNSLLVWDIGNNYVGKMDLIAGKLFEGIY